MPYQYLKDRSHYEERYDRITVELGRTYDHDVLIDRKVVPGKGRTKQWTFEAYVVHPFLESTLLDRYEKREATIQLWIEEDRKRDERLAKAVEPRFICPRCDRRTDSVYKGLDYQTERVSFMMKCRDCRKVYRVTESGIQIKRDPIRCTKCKKAVTCSVREQNGATQYVDTCKHCGHVEVITPKREPEPSVEEKEQEQALFQKDRERYCWDALRADRYRMDVASFWATLDHVFSEKPKKTEPSAPPRQLRGMRKRKRR